MSGKRYTDEFKDDAAKQVIKHGHEARDVAELLGISLDSLYGWVRERRKASATRVAETNQAAEIRRLQAKLKRVTEQRDILEKGAAYFAKGRR